MMVVVTKFSVWENPDIHEMTFENLEFSQMNVGRSVEGEGCDALNEGNVNCQAASSLLLETPNPDPPRILEPRHHTGTAT